MVVTASGQASSTAEQVEVVYQAGKQEACPAEYASYQGGWVGANEVNGHFHQAGEPKATTPTFSDTFTFTFGAGSLLCGYLTMGEGGSTVAATEIHVTYGPDKEEVEQARREKEAQETNAALQKANEERAAAERRAGEEERAKRAAEVAANARSLATYLQGVATRRNCEYLKSDKLEEVDPELRSMTRTVFEGIIKTCEADEEAQRAQERAEEQAAERAAHARPVTGLSVRVHQALGGTSTRPGHSELLIHTSPFAYVAVTLKRYGHRAERWEADGSGVGGSLIEWTCKRPGGTYHYTVTAREGVGRTLTKKGHFKPVSTAHCHTLKQHEQEARERSAHRYAERVRQEREAERERQREGEFNCRQRGGTVVQLYVEGEPRLGCRGPLGGLIPWIP